MRASRTVRCVTCALAVGGLGVAGPLAGAAHANDITDPAHCTESVTGTVTCTYNAPGSFVFTVPTGVVALTGVQVAGAAGNATDVAGGAGAVVGGTLTVLPGDALAIGVSTGGGAAYRGGTGGGKSDIADPATATATNPSGYLLVAAGGGGAGNVEGAFGFEYSGRGGAADAPGMAGTADRGVRAGAGGGAGTTTAGGQPGDTTATGGRAGQGGSSGAGGGGGGGGFYGGGGGGTGSSDSFTSSYGGDGGGGGGASFCSPLQLQCQRRTLTATTPTVVFSYLDPTFGLPATPPSSVPEAPLAVVLPAAALGVGYLGWRLHRPRNRT